MAELEELNTLYGDVSGDTMKNKIESACMIVAEGVLNDASAYPTATADTTLQKNRELWAVRVIERTKTEADYMWKILLGKFHDSSVATITDATKATIISEVESKVDVVASNMTESVTTGP